MSARPAGARTRPLAAALILGLAGVGPPTHALAQRSPSRPPFLRLGAEAGAGSVYDTNLERRHDGFQSWGWTAAAAANLRAQAGPASLSLGYRVEAHRFDADERWNRVTRLASAITGIRISRVLLLDVTAEHVTGRASEDREIGDEYALLPRLELRPDGRNRIRIRAGYRVRNYGDLGGRDARNRLIGFDYRIGPSGGARVELGSRYEINATDDARNGFHRWTHRVRFNAPLATGTEIAFELYQYSRTYPDRLLSMEAPTDLSDEGVDILAGYRDTGAAAGSNDAMTDQDLFPRHDQIWAPSIVLLRAAGPVEVQIAYQFEARLSNDLRRGYTGHTTTVTTRVRY